MKDLTAFQHGHADSEGAAGCISRMQQMEAAITKFCTFVRLEDGLLGKSTVLGKQDTENLVSSCFNVLHCFTRFYII